MAEAFYADDFSYDLLPFNTYYSYNDISDDSSASSSICTPDGLDLALSLPELNTLDSYSYSPFGTSCGIAPQALHEPYEKDDVDPVLLAPQEEEVPVVEESDDAGSIYADSNDDEETYDDDYVEFVKRRRPKAPASVALASSKRTHSSAFSALDVDEEARPVKRIARTVPSSPIQTKPHTPIQAKSVSPAPRKSRSRMTRGQPSPRNIQLKERVRISKAFITSLNLVCPQRVYGCRHTSNNKRISDFTRHLKTHGYILSASTEIICTGVRLSDAHMFSKVEGKELQEVYTIEEGDGNELWVGGCRKSFSRTDALKRHCDSKGNKCVNYALLQKQ